MKSDSRLLFALLCFFWGTNWLATKIGVDVVPPITFAAARSLGMGVVMLLLAGPRAVGSLFAGAPVRCTLVGALTNTATYAGLYWGITRLSTGLTAIVNNALMPIGLLVFGLMLGEETISRRRVAGIALGVAGLSLLFARRTGDAVDAAALAAVALGTLAYCLGSVLARPLLRQASPLAVGGVQMLAGGILLVPIAILLEQPDAGTLAGLLKPAVLASWAWLVFAGGAFAVWIYLRLIRDWGPTRAGMYAFVSPVIATALGAVVLGERLGPLEIAGALVMLAAAGLVLPTPRAAATSRT